MEIEGIEIEGVPTTTAPTLQEIEEFRQHTNSPSALALRLNTVRARLAYIENFGGDHLERALECLRAECERLLARRRVPSNRA